ncbi:hypothetical protein J1N35_041484 [Gossypium stocksii]|uniref:Uncharacterized protein n=1 Tax=Gossypium stocksii TaxID=47602 RepID=A0A9D3UFM2_9ROSI|nr:hypothetical protein J1N35_041484 [Gossypium stocksii]
MAINVKPISTQVKGTTKVTLTERQQKKYSFLNIDIPKMLEEMIKPKLIQLPKMKQLKEADHVDDPNYRKYHQLISHPLEVFCVER